LNIYQEQIFYATGNLWRYIVKVLSIIINKQLLKSTKFKKYDSEICRPIYHLCYWVPFSVALFDKTIKYVPPICINDLEKDLPMLMSFVSYLWTYRPKMNKLFMNLIYVYVRIMRQWNVQDNSMNIIILVQNLITGFRKIAVVIKISVINLNLILIIF